MNTAASYGLMQPYPPVFAPKPILDRTEFLVQQPASHTPFVTERVSLPPLLRTILRNRPSPFADNVFGEAVYHRTYSRTRADGTQERWHDTVIRAIEGMLSIRKNHYVTNDIPWDEAKWIGLGADMAVAAYDLKWGCPGRGWWAMGTDYVYERGGMSLNNCGFVDVRVLSSAAKWAMNALMCGVGIGFDTRHFHELSYAPNPDRTTTIVIADDREGWVDSVESLLMSYEGPGRPTIAFDYSRIRPKGSPIVGFGGTSAGHEPLQKLHERIRHYMDDYLVYGTSPVRVCTDVMNAIGACVVAGNVRRSAEIALGRLDDDVFRNLKNYDLHPERADIGWMSNNSVVLETSDDFLRLPDIADRIRANGEPGIVNMVNIRKFGRLFEPSLDPAVGTNPCAEIPLCDRELCNLAETYPSRCASHDEFMQAVDYATIYASTVALLGTSDDHTTAIMHKNRRIGVGVTGIADWMENTPSSLATRWLRDGYKQIRLRNNALAIEAKVPDSIRLTTVKPSGTVSQLANVSPGMHWHTFPYAIRRMRVAEDAPIADVLDAAGVPNEPDVYSDNTRVFEFPVDQSRSRPATTVSVWQQAARVAMLQREWADNMVSNTIYFAPHESKEIEHVMAEFAPLTKTMSFLPHTEQGAYQQMPYEGIDKDEYARRRDAISPVDWDAFTGSDGVEERFCTTTTCL